ISQRQSLNIVPMETKMSLAAQGPFRGGSKFWLVAMVRKPRPGQSVALTLPEGLSARQPAAVSQPVPAGGASTPVRWRLEAAAGTVGPGAVEAVPQPEGIRQRQDLTFLPVETRLALLPRGPFRSGRSFWISCQVTNPRPGQSVALTLPVGLTLKDGDAAL